MSTPPSGSSSAKTGSKAMGDLIKRRREELGKSRQELADLTGVPYPTIAQIETGYRGASASRLNLIAGALGLNAAGLLDALSSDVDNASSALRSPRGDTPSDAASRGEWIANPNYAGAAEPPVARAVFAMSGPEPVSPDAVIEQVVGLLSELPSESRLDALARVQSRLLSGLVQDEVRRATAVSDGGSPS
jgi:transcriptional regulator with XRE-family HTH domain